MTSRTPKANTRSKSTSRTSVVPSVTNTRANTNTAPRVSTVSAATAAIGAIPSVSDENNSAPISVGNSSTLSSDVVTSANITSASAIETSSSTITLPAAILPSVSQCVNTPITSTGLASALSAASAAINVPPHSLDWNEMNSNASDSEESTIESINNIAVNNELVVPDNLMEINAELALLQAQEQLLAARLRVQRLQAAVGPSVVSSTSVVTKKRIKAADVEYLVPIFTGDDEYGVRKWIDDFEDIMKSLKGEPDDYYKMARHLIRDTAKIYLRTIRVKNYDELKRAILQRYDRQVSFYEVYEKLRSRYRRRDESLMQYITSMQEIA